MRANPCGKKKKYTDLFSANALHFKKARAVRRRANPCVNKRFCALATGERQVRFLRNMVLFFERRCPFFTNFYMLLHVYARAFSHAQLVARCTGTRARFLMCNWLRGVLVRKRSFATVKNWVFTL